MIMVRVRKEAANINDKKVLFDIVSGKSAASARAPGFLLSTSFPTRILKLPGFTSSLSLKLIMIVSATDPSLSKSSS